MFCPGCGTWNRTRAVNCLRCKGALPELREIPREVPDPEISLVERYLGEASSADTRTPVVFVGSTSRGLRRASMIWPSV